MDLAAWLTANQFATAGLATVAFGAALTAARALPGRLWNAVLSRWTVTVEVRDVDDAFGWVSAWLADHKSTRTTRTLSAAAKPPRAEGQPPEVELSPAPGSHLVRHDGMRVMVTRAREDGKEKKPRESFTLRILSSDVGAARRIMEAARDHALKPKIGFVDLYMPRWGWWRRVGTLRTRPLETVSMPDSAAGLLDDIRRFLAGEESYASRGVPYQRGYLLHGPPGNGKTSVVRALAGELGLDLYLMDLADATLTDLELQWLLSTVPRRGLLLFEDIDHVVERVQAPPPPSTTDATPGEAKVDAAKAGITISGLLNALDGIIGGQGRISILTSNRPWILPDNLKRPGRVDLAVEFPNATRRQALETIARFFGDAPPGLTYEDGSLSVAEVQECCVNATNADDAMRAVERAGLVKAEQVAA